MKEYIEKILEDGKDKEMNESLGSRFNMLLMKNRMQKNIAENDIFKVLDEFYYISPVPTGARRKVHIAATVDVNRFAKWFMNNAFDGISIVNPCELLYYPYFSVDNKEIYDTGGNLKTEYCKKLRDKMSLVNDSNVSNRKVALFDLVINDFRADYSLVTLKKEHHKRMKSVNFSIDDCIDQGLVFEKGVCKAICTEHLLDLVVDGIVHIVNSAVIDAEALIASSTIPIDCFESE